MAKYIDAEKLIHDLEERIFAYSEGYAEGGDNRKDAIETLLKDVKYQYSLQQEQSKIEEDWVEKRKQECGCRRLSADGSYQCERYEGSFGPCDGRCSWIVDCPKLKGLKEMKQPEVDLEKEIVRFLSNSTKMNKGACRGKYAISDIGFRAVARHFFELGQRKAAEMYDEIEYNRQRSEEQMLGKTLDVAAENYTDSSEWLIGENLEHLDAAFKAGAKWMAGQGVSWEDKMTYYDGFLLYGKDERAFTMEGDFNEGDKVIVQIRKK